MIIKKLAIVKKNKEESIETEQHISNSDKKKIVYEQGKFYN